MKMLVAVIRNEDLPAVQEALDRQVACLVSVTPVQSHGPDPGLTGLFRGLAYRVRRTRLRVEIALEDEFVPAAARAIARAASEGDSDPTYECNIFVVPGEPVEVIRTRD